LLRINGGEIFTSYQKISENSLATHMRLSVVDVRKMLLFLHRSGIIQYQPRHDSPQALFTTPRYDADKLPLDQKHLRATRELAQQKTAAVVRYASGGRCRQQLLLEYFGELDAPACQVCDYCLARKKQQKPPVPTPALRQQLLQLVRTNPQTPREIVSQFAPAQSSTVTELLRELVDRGELRYAADGRLG
jgi:ATP-dependent DNA helicase RecQ